MNKVYFSASITGRKHYLANYLKIVELLKSRKYYVISHHITDANETAIAMETKEDRLKFHKQLEKWIGSCDFMIAETSFPSISVGYEISLALQLNKPVLILYSEGDPPSLLAHHKDENLVCEKYTLDTVKDIIEDFINYTQGTADIRFTFFITPEISLHLERISKEEKMPKSVYLRKLIERDMENRSKNP